MDLARGGGGIISAGQSTSMDEVLVVADVPHRQPQEVLADLDVRLGGAGEGSLGALAGRAQAAKGALVLTEATIKD